MEEYKEMLAAALRETADRGTFTQLEVRNMLLDLWNALEVNGIATPEEHVPLPV